MIFAFSDAGISSKYSFDASTASRIFRYRSYMPRALSDIERAPRKSGAISSVNTPDGDATVAIRAPIVTAAYTSSPVSPPD